MDDEAHIKAFPCRSEFWDSLKVSDLLPNICESLKSMYQATYTSSAKGKDKQMQFVPQWYQKCSGLLMEKKPDTYNSHGQSDTIIMDFRNK